MSSIYGTAIYKKNVPTAERVIRAIASILVIAGAMLWIADARLRWAAIATGVMFALTSAFGFCPACYVAGRKLST